MDFLKYGDKCFRVISTYFLKAIHQEKKQNIRDLYTFYIHFSKSFIKQGIPWHFIIHRPWI